MPNLSPTAPEKSRFLLDSHMLQVGISYSITYHSKASKGGGVPDHLLDKMAANLVKSSQSQDEKSKNFFRKLRSQREFWLRVPSKKADFWLVHICCK
jgi:hypothetical protein